MSQFTPRRGVAWSKVGDVGVIINPWRERMIGLSAAAYDGWERLVSGNAAPGRPSPVGPAPSEAAGSPVTPGPSGALPEPGMLAFFRQMGLFEGDGGDPSPEPLELPELPPQVLWMERFQPLAFTYSCGTKPMTTPECNANPSTGAGKGILRNQRR